MVIKQQKRPLFTLSIAATDQKAVYLGSALLHVCVHVPLFQ